MPLSEHERRILNQIEQRLYEQDPASAERISSTTLPRYLARNCRWATLGFLAGLVVLVVSFSTSWLLGVCGFAIMVASALVFTQNLRKMGRHGWQQLSSSLRDRSVGDVVGDTGRRLRRRFGEGRDSDR
ncbi:MAG: DUF3040 domain-containing protein [Acidimicrobiales bacterium]